MISKCYTHKSGLAKYTYVRITYGGGGGLASHGGLWLRGGGKIGQKKRDVIIERLSPVLRCYAASAGQAGKLNPVAPLAGLEAKSHQRKRLVAWIRHWNFGGRRYRQALTFWLVWSTTFTSTGTKPPNCFARNNVSPRAHHGFVASVIQELLNNGCITQGEIQPRYCNSRTVADGKKLRFGLLRHVK